MAASFRRYLWKNNDRETNTICTISLPLPQASISTVKMWLWPLMTDKMCSERIIENLIGYHTSRTAVLQTVIND